MKFSLHELRSSLDAAAEFDRLYHQRAEASQSPRKLRDHFLPLAREYTGHNIEAFELDEKLPHESIYGYFVAEEKGFSILISKGQTFHEPQVRFVLCKEIFHGILKSDGSNAKDVCGHLDEIEVAFPVRDSEPGAAVKSELLAEIAAMEFLFPFKARIEELKQSPIDYAEIAERYLIPQYLVEIYLHPSYMAELGAMVTS
jgi:Zn-dependent peptidase ImmA (M78 family)